MTEPTDWVAKLVEIMARLRAPDGCPWDREQSHESLKPYLIEEAYELIDAIDDEDDEHLRDELGDVLLPVVFHAQIAAEDERFDLQAVARTIAEKLLRRHPHVFGETTVEDSAGVLRQWEAIKRTERAGQKRESALDGVPRHLPALSQAEKLQKKAAKLGFDWPSQAGVVEKIEEELGELKAALAADDTAAIDEEIGDLLFSIANLTRYRKRSAEELLRQTSHKFYHRFRHIERAVAASGRPFSEWTLEEMDAVWNDAKRQEPGTE